MAKKETKKKLKELKQKAEANAAAGSSSAAGQQAQPDAKGKKSKKASKKISDEQIDRSKLTADQMTQAQIEEAIKESQDPTSRLKKLRSPLSVKGCLLNILILVVLTVAIVLLCCYLMLDKETFDLGVVVYDMLENFGVIKIWNIVKDWVVGIFS